MLDVCELEQPLGVAVSFGGQTPLQARARRSRRRACRCSATRSTRSTPPRTAAASPRLAGDLAPEWGVAENAEEAREVAHRLGYPVLVRPHHVLGGRGMHVAHSADELRVEGPVPRRPLPRRARWSSTSTRSATARAPGSRRSSSTSSRRASTPATRRAFFPGPSVSPALEDEIREVATRIAAGRRRARAHEPPARAHATGSSACSRRTRAPRGRCRSSPRRPACRSSSTPCGCCSASRLAALGLPERAVPSRAWAKEAVFPAERFPGAADRGPEMRSTGEVMAGAAHRCRGVRARACERPAARSGAAGSARRCRQQRYASPMRDILDAIDAATAGGREGRRRDRDRHDPVGAAPARREDGRPRERQVHRVRLGRLRRGRRRRAREADLRRRGSTSRPLRRHRRRGLGGRSLVRRRDRRLDRAGRSRRCGATCARCSTRTATGCSTRTPRRARSGSSAACSRAPASATTASFAEVVEGPLAGGDLRRRRGRRAPLLLRQEARLAHDGRRRPPRARDARARTERRQGGQGLARRGRRPDRRAHRRRDALARGAPRHPRGRRRARAERPLRRRDRRQAHPGAPPHRARRAGLLRGRPRPDPRPGRHRPRRPLAGAGRARDRGRDRRGHLGRPRQEQGRPRLRSATRSPTSRTSPSRPARSGLPVRRRGRGTGGGR